MKNRETFPIKVVSNITGLSIHVIRAWEKRYNVVVPQRTDTNRRLYSEDDVEKLNLLSLATSHGYGIGNIANHSIEELKRLLGIASPASVKSDPINIDSRTSDSSDDYLIKCLSAVRNLDSKSLELELYHALKNLTQPKFIEKLITPLLEKIGEMWKNGEIRIVNEHVASAVIRKILVAIMDNNTVPLNAPSLIVATPKGQMHELGALIIAVIASADGWDVTYIGPDLPAEEIAAAIDRLHPKLVALSIVYPNDDFTLDKEMTKLKKLLNNGTQIIAGGRSVMTYEKTLSYLNAKIIRNMGEFKLQLENYR